MNHQIIIHQLESHIDLFRQLFIISSSDLAVWKPERDSWSLLEIINHLTDEEIDDFRMRVDHCLHHPSDQQPPSIDPQGWITGRNYAARNYDESVTKFITEREKSISWLKHLNSPDWSRSFVHPKFGNLSAEFFLFNWLAHDYHHIRQINKVKYLYLREHAADISLQYAGEW